MNIDHIKQKIFDISPEAVLILDEKANILDVNKKTEDWTGYSKKDLVGKPVWKLPYVGYSKGNQELAQKKFAQRIKGTKIEPYDFEAKTKKGEIIFGRVSGELIKENGKVTNVVIMVSDVTKLHKAEERFRTTLDNMLEGVQIIDREWKYAYLNEAIIVQGKKTREELIGKTMMEAYPGIEDTELFKILKKCMSERIADSLENQFEFPDGSRGVFELRVQPVPEGILILSLDVSDHRKKMEDLRKLNKQFIDREIRMAELKAQLKSKA